MFRYHLATSGILKVRFASCASLRHLSSPSFFATSLVSSLQPGHAASICAEEEDLRFMVLR